MANMLTSEDLKAIGQVVEDKIEDALVVVNKGFSDLEERFGKRFDGVETRLTGVETRLTGVETRLTNVEGKVTNIERQLNRTDGKVNALVNVMEKKRVITEGERRAVLL